MGEALPYSLGPRVGWGRVRTLPSLSQPGVSCRTRRSSVLEIEVYRETSYIVGRGPGRAPLVWSVLFSLSVHHLRPRQALAGFQVAAGWETVSCRQKKKKKFQCPPFRSSQSNWREKVGVPPRK